MGSGESRIHVPKGGANGGAAMAIATHNTNSGNVDCLTTRPTKFNSFRIAFIPPLRIELGDTMLQRRFLPFKDNPNAIENSASSRTHDCLGPAHGCQSIGHHDLVGPHAPAPAGSRWKWSAALLSGYTK